MKAASQVTYILLEDPVEVQTLWIEINKIIATLKIESYKDFIKEFPLIWELKNSLKTELDSREE